MRAAIGLLLIAASVLAASLGHAEEIDAVTDVVGVAECADCKENNFDTKQAFQGLSVSLHCKAADGGFKARGSAALDESGHFKLSLPKKTACSEQCYVQLRSVFSSPCPTHGSLEATKLIQSPDTKGALGIASGSLHFSPVTCASKFYWHFSQNHPVPSMNGPLGPLPLLPKDGPHGPLPLPPMDGPLGRLLLPPKDGHLDPLPLPLPPKDWLKGSLPLPPTDGPIEHDPRTP